MAVSHLDHAHATFTTGEILAKYRCVKLSASRTVSYADAGQDAIGVTLDAAASGAEVGVALFNKEGTFIAVCSAAVTVNNKVYTAADGKVSMTATGIPLGTALTAGSANNSHIEVLPLTFDQFLSNMAGVYGFEDDFFNYVSADLWTLTASNSGTATGANEVGGILDLAASDGTAADNDESYLHNTFENFKFAATKPLWFEARVACTEANTDDVNLAVGMMDAWAANSILDDAGGPSASYSGAVFYKIDGGTVWLAEVSIAGTQTAVTLSTDTFPGDGTYQRLGIEFLPGSGATDGTVNFYIDGALVGSATSWTYTSATEMEAGAGVKNGSANAEVLKIDYMRAAQVR